MPFQLAVVSQAAETSFASEYLDEKSQKLEAENAQLRNCQPG